MADVHIPYGNTIYKVNSGAIRFTLKTIAHKAEIKLLDDEQAPLYKIVLGRVTKVIKYMENSDKELRRYETLDLIDFLLTRQFCLTWYSNKIKLFLETDLHETPMIEFGHTLKRDIAFIKFKPLWQGDHMNTPAPVTWMVETSPVILDEVPKKKFSEDLQWVHMTDGRLPPNAMIGGFDKELTYIARALHNSALCPGKYVPSKRLAYVAWGHEEHSKTEFDILCGYNAKWVKTVSGYDIPLNAFVGGNSEFSEPLYIGRAIIDGNIVTGKVHLLYKTCYLPYNGREVEVSSYEVLVIPELDVPQVVKGIGDTTSAIEDENYYVYAF